jgi:hypothetical protein
MRAARQGIWYSTGNGPHSGPRQDNGTPGHCKRNFFIAVGATAILAGGIMYGISSHGKKVHAEHAKAETSQTAVHPQEIRH